MTVSVVTIRYDNNIYYSENNNGGGIIAGCAATIGGGAAAAVAKAGCSGGGKAITSKVTASTLGKASVGAGISGGVGAKSLETAGRNYLKDLSIKEILNNKELLKELPDLEKSLKSGMSIDNYLDKNPMASFKAGQYLLSSDQKAFNKHLFSKNDDVVYGGYDGGATTKLKSEAYSEADIILKQLSELSTNFTHETLKTLAAHRNAQLGSYKHISIDGMYVNITVSNNNFSYSIKIDVLSTLAKGAGTHATYVIVNKTIIDKRNETQQKSKNQ